MGIGIEEKQDGVHKLHGYEINNVNDKLGKIADVMGENLDVDNPLQLISSLDNLSKQMFYKNTGTDNDLQLVRDGVNEDIESLSPDMGIFFIANGPNTGNMSVKINHLTSKSLRVGGNHVPADYIIGGQMYICTYDVVAGYFNIFSLGGGGGTPGADPEELGYFIGDDGVSRIYQPFGLSGEITQDERVIRIRLPYTLRGKPGKTISLSFMTNISLLGSNFIEGNITITKHNYSSNLNNDNLGANIHIKEFISNPLESVGASVDDDYTYVYLQFTNSVLNAIFSVTEVIINEDEITVAAWNSGTDLRAISAPGGGPTGQAIVERLQYLETSSSTLMVDGLINKLISGGAKVENSDPDVTQFPKLYTDHADGPTGNNLIISDWLIEDRLTPNPAVIQHAYNIDGVLMRHWYRYRRTTGSGMSVNWVELPTVNFGEDIGKGLNEVFLKNSGFELTKITNSGGTSIRGLHALHLHGGDKVIEDYIREKLFADILGITVANIPTSVKDTLLLSSDENVYICPSVNNETAASVLVSHFTVIKPDGVYVNGGADKLAVDAGIFKKDSMFESDITVLPDNDTDYTAIDFHIENSNSSAISSGRRHIGYNFSMEELVTGGDETDVNAGVTTIGLSTGVSVLGRPKLVGHENSIGVDGDTRWLTGIETNIYSTGDVYQGAFGSDISMVFERNGMGTDPISGEVIGYHILIDGKANSVGFGAIFDGESLSAEERMGIRIHGDTGNELSGYLQAKNFISMGGLDETILSNSEQTALIRQVTTAGGLLTLTHLNHTHTGYSLEIANTIYQQAFHAYTIGGLDPSDTPNPLSLVSSMGKHVIVTEIEEAGTPENTELEHDRAYVHGRDTFSNPFTVQYSCNFPTGTIIAGGRWVKLGEVTMYNRWETIEIELSIYDFKTTISLTPAVASTTLGTPMSCQAKGNFSPIKFVYAEEITAGEEYSVFLFIHEDYDDFLVNVSKTPGVLWVPSISAGAPSVLTVGSDGYHVNDSLILLTDKYSSGVYNNVNGEHRLFALSGYSENWLTVGYGANYIDTTLNIYLRTPDGIKFSMKAHLQYDGEVPNLVMTAPDYVDGEGLSAIRILHNEDTDNGLVFQVYAADLDTDVVIAVSSTSNYPGGDFVANRLEIPIEKSNDTSPLGTVLTDALTFNLLEAATSGSQPSTLFTGITINNPDKTGTVYQRNVPNAASTLILTSSGDVGEFKVLSTGLTYEGEADDSYKHVAVIEEFAHGLTDGAGPATFNIQKGMTFITGKIEITTSDNEAYVFQNNFATVCLGVVVGADGLITEVDQYGFEYDPLRGNDRTVYYMAYGY